MTISAGEGIRADLARWTIGAIGLVVVRSDRARVERRGNRDGERQLVMHFQRRGRLALTQGGRTVVARAGGIAVAHDAEPYAIDISDRNDCMVLRLPLAALGHEAERADWRAAVLDGADPAVSLLGRVLEETERAGANPSADAQIGGLLNDVLISTLRVACLRASGPEATRRSSVVGFALRHLTDPALSTAMIADDAGLTARGVQKAFIRETGRCPSAFIRDTRLDRAAKLLGTYNTRAITDIAFDVGFEDSAFFSRCFRKRFALSPSQWRARHG